MTAPDTPAAPEDFLAHRQWLAALARRLVRDDATADDVVQDTLLTALEKPPRDKGSLRAWLGRVLRNRVLQSARAEGRRSAREADSRQSDPMPSPEQVVARSETQRRVLAAVHSLDEPYRTTVLLRFYEERDAREIAAHLGLPLETVRTRLKRGVQLLRGALEREYGDERRWRAALLPLLGSPAPVAPPPGPPVPAAPGPLLPGLARLAPLAIVAVCAALTVIALRSAVAPHSPSGPTRDPVTTSSEPVEPSASGSAELEERRARRRDRQPTTSPPAQPVDLRSLPTIPIVVRCVQDGDPVPGLILDWEGRRPEQDERIKTGVGGNATVPTDALHNLVSRSTSWALLDPSRPFFSKDGVVWAVRLTSVRGRVEERDGSVPSVERLEFTLRDPRGRPDLWEAFVAQLDDEVPKDIRQEVEAFLKRKITRPRPDGTFLWRFAHLRGLFVDPGWRWRRDAYAVPYHPDPAQIPELVIRLAPWPVVTGVVLGPDGKPVPGAYVRVGVPERLIVNPRWELRDGKHHVVAPDPANESRRRLAGKELETDDDGSFSVQPHWGPDSEPCLFVYPRNGYAPVRRRLGPVGDGLTGLQVVVDVPVHAREVAWREPEGFVRPGLIGVTDVTGDWPEVRLWIRVGEKGVSDAGALELGRTYEVTQRQLDPSEKTPLRFTWRGDNTIRLERSLDPGAKRGADASEGEGR